MQDKKIYIFAASVVGLLALAAGANYFYSKRNAADDSVGE